MDLKLVCHYMLPVIFIWAQPSSAVETYDDLYVGCFTDSTQSRVLPDAILITDNMTITVCIDYCTGLNDTDSAYAGVELANECYCGVASRNYSRFGVLEDGDCNFPCMGNITYKCGGQGKISIYNLLLIRPPTTTETFSSSVIQTSPDASTAFDKRTEESDESTIPISTRSTKSDPSTLGGVQSTLMSSLQPVSGDKSNIVLYAGAGGGGTFLLILIIIIIVFVTCRRRNTEKRSPATDHPLTTMIASKDDNQADEEGDPCYENKSAETERDYQNMTVVDAREYVNLPEVMDNKEQTCINSEKRSDMEEATHNPAALYAMPDLSAKTSFRPKTYTSPPNDTDDPSLLYAMPDRRTKTVNSRNGKPALEEDSLDALYTTSTKHRLEPIGMEAMADGEDLYALPDKNRSDHVTQSGAGTRDAVEAMYAMPDKSRGGHDVDNTVMVENDIYSST